MSFKKLLRTDNLARCFVLITIGMVFSISAVAQDSEPPEDSSDKIARELSNPNTALGTMAFPLDFIFYDGDLPNAGQQFGTLLNFQPSLPIPISEGFNLFVRPLIPIYLTQPVMGVNGFENKGVELGNISADVAVGKTWPSKTITILGIFGGFPTATDDALKSNFTTLGPEFMVAQMYSWGVLGLMVSHAWSLNSHDAEAMSGTVLPDDMWTSNSDVTKETASITAGQYFYVFNLKNAWQITGQPTYSYNHKAEKGNRLTLPIGTGVNKVVKVGNLPVKLSAQYWYYVASPDSFGPKHQIRIQFAPVIPLPW